MTTFFGFTARLVIEDEHGEYEVHDALRTRGYGEPIAEVDMQRVADAVALRAKANRATRPIL